MAKTYLKKIVIEKFRGLNNVDVNFGEFITVICGKNGTSKSSILGIVAQIFSFEKNYTSNEKISFTQVSGKSFKSRYSEHFRISRTYDQPGSMIVKVELFDGYSSQDATGSLELMKRGALPRPVVRNNSTSTKLKNKSRNFTHPVVFLSLKRLYPIADRNYKVKNFEFFQDSEMKKEFILLSNQLLNRTSSIATGTEGTISSSVAHGSNYDHESVSAGEDNAGQIILAILSFKKLKKEYGSDYKGGLLLIDEADASLFPTAQLNLLKILEDECRALNLQVIMTSHSPSLIQYAYEKSIEPYQKKFQTVYLTDVGGCVVAKQNYLWEEIDSDLNTKTRNLIKGVSIPKVNIYFEDKEASDFFQGLLHGKSILGFINLMTGVKLGCGNYINLIENNVPEFSKTSVVCLDADAKNLIQDRGFNNVVLLPGHLPPDQLIFEFLYNLPADHSVWKNPQLYTKDVFNLKISTIKRQLRIIDKSVNLKILINGNKNISKDKPIRDIFKDFYNDSDFQKIVSDVSSAFSPWSSYIKEYPHQSSMFLKIFSTAFREVLNNIDYKFESNISKSLIDNAIQELENEL